MNSYLYDDDDVQSEETTEFRQHETEMEYGGEYDAVKVGILCENDGLFY